MKDIKILIGHNYYANSGGESLVYKNEVFGLQSYGHYIIEYNKMNEDIYRYSKVKKTLFFFTAFYSFITRKEIARIILREKPDLAIIQNVFPIISPSIYLTLKSLSVPVIQTVYNYRLICPQAELYTKGEICERCIQGNYINAVRYKCYRNSYLTSAWYASIIGVHRFLKTFNRCIDMFMVPDHFLGDKLVHGGIDSKKIFRNPNPFFVDQYLPSEDHQGYFLFIGRFLRQKGVMTLLQAMTKTQSNAKLIFVGRGEMLRSMEQFIVDRNLAGKVKVLPPLWGSDVEKMINGSLAVVIPSEWYDNLPLILCQANACGKPVIASRINGIPEYIKENYNGFLFEPGNADELAEKIDQLAKVTTKQYRALAHSARKFAVDIFDYNNHYQILMENIKTLLES